MSNQEKKEKNTVSFEFSVSGAELEEAIEKAYRKNVGKISIPGFRKGKAPRKIIENYYGKEVFYEDAINIALPPAYDKAVEEQKLEPVAQPEIDIKGEISKENGVVFTAKVVVKPDFELGTYKGVEVNKITYKTYQKDIDAELEKMRKNNGRKVTVEDRPVQKDDTVNIDFEGFVDGAAFEGGKGEGFDLTIGSGQFIPGFEDQLIGKNIGDETEVNVTFPEEYHAEELKGKDAVFKVKIHSIQVEELPELDDEFAKDVSEFDTLDALKDDIREKLKTANKNRAKQELENNIVETISNNTEIDIPDEMIETQIENMLRDFDMQMRYQGIDLQRYMQYTGTTLDSLKEQFREDAGKRVKTSLVLEKIAKVENIEVTEQDIEKEYETICEQNGMKMEDVRKYVHEHDVRDRLQLEKTVKFCVDNAVVK